MDRKRRYVNSVVTRAIAACVLLAAFQSPMSVQAREAQAVAPSITVAPSSVLPHGTVQVTGTGFDPTTSGKQISVVVSVVTNAGETVIGDVHTDVNGNISGASLTLPFSIDAMGVDQVVASEVGSSGLGATQLITGTALTPVVAMGGTLQGVAGMKITVHGSGFDRSIR